MCRTLTAEYLTDRFSFQLCSCKPVGAGSGQAAMVPEEV